MVAIFISVVPRFVKSNTRIVMTHWSRHFRAGSRRIVWARPAKPLLQRGIAWLAEEQEMLYAQDRWSLLLVFQAMDAAGKDSTIEHVMSGINPQGCQVFSFKQPSSEDLDHDFMWRYVRHLPARGRIGIFNRSYYEEVLVVRVHPEILKAQKLPPPLVGKGVTRNRFSGHGCRTRGNGKCRSAIFFILIHVSRRRWLRRIRAPCTVIPFSDVLNSNRAMHA